MPLRDRRAALFAKVAIDQVRQRRDGLVRVGPIGSDRDRRPLAHTEG